LKYRKLVLFDIDGTLMDTDGAGNASFVHALSTVFDRPFSAEGYSASGKTDTQIAMELATQFGVPEAEFQPHLEAVRTLYLEGLKSEIEKIEPTVFTGVRELVASVSENPTCVTGLLTGNFEPAGWMKVGRIDLSDPFEMGAFGDDAPARHYLPDKAVVNALELTGQTFSEKEIVIIGDTPNDVACGRHLNVTSIAVATGHYSEGDLAKAEPDFLFGDFSRTSPVMDAILR
jgi:phosphoglycolate phosphatase